MRIGRELREGGVKKGRERLFRIDDRKGDEGEQGDDSKREGSE